MANPQKENGYIAIATELYEAMISFRIPGECEQVVKAIFRKTYGYNKKEDSISNSQFVEMTKLDKSNISRSLVKLIKNKVVVKTDNKKRTGNVYKINKDYQEWIPFVVRSDNKKKSKKLLSKRKPLLSGATTVVVRSDNKLLSEVTDTIDNNHIITNIQKTENVPSILTKTFFKGVQDLRTSQNEKKPVESEEGKITQKFLKELQEKYPDAPKNVIWGEIQKFERYWTEKNKTGKKQLWEMQKTFEVDRRLVTWFGRVKGFNFNSSIKTNNQKQIRL